MKTPSRDSALFLAVMTLAFPGIESTKAASWLTTASMSTNRAYHTATLLPNGKVLVAGGSATNVTELYDATVGSWTRTGSLVSNRWEHTATLLPNGKVLVVGGGGAGFYAVNNLIASAEIYDPATGIWTATGPLHTARGYHTATLLTNGKVLATGGDNGSYDTFSSTELYDPNTGVWSVTGAMSSTRCYHTATLLPNGKVLVAGGEDGYSLQAITGAELYDPATSTWTGTGSLHTARGYHTATLLQTGKVLITGGDDGFGGVSYSSAELFDLTTGSWATLPSMSKVREAHTATLLPNGNVLITGGQNVNLNYVATSSAELFDPGVFGSLLVTLNPTGAVSAGAQWQVDNVSFQNSGTTVSNLSPGSHTITLKTITGWATPSNQVAIIASNSTTTAVGNYTQIAIFINTNSMPSAQGYHTAILLPNRKVLVVGGNSTLYNTVDGTWRGLLR